MAPNEPNGEGAVAPKALEAVPPNPVEAGVTLPKPVEDGVTVPKVGVPMLAAAGVKAELVEPKLDPDPNPEGAEGVAEAPNPGCDAPNPAPNPVEGLAALAPNALVVVLDPNCGVEAAAAPNPPPNPGVLAPKADPADCPNPVP